VTATPCAVRGEFTSQGIVEGTMVNDPAFWAARAYDFDRIRQKHSDQRVCAFSSPDGWSFNPVGAALRDRIKTVADACAVKGLEHTEAIEPWMDWLEYLCEGHIEVRRLVRSRDAQSWSKVAERMIPYTTYKIDDVCLASARVCRKLETDMAKAAAGASATPEVTTAIVAWRKDSVKRFRLERDLSAADLGRHVPMDPSQIRAIIKDDRKSGKCNATAQKRLLQKLGVTLDDWYATRN
jgi:hypothetical protein